MKTLLFVDDEAKVLQGLQRQLRLMRHEWDMHFVDGGLPALAFMAEHPVDVIVSDMIMPCMDGSQLLSEVSQRHPSTVRIVLSGHAEREAVMRLIGPAHQYLSKPCNADELREAVARAFALRDMLVNDRLKKLATRLKCLPVLPTLYKQLTEELRNDEPSLDRVGEIIFRDIGMTAKILQLVNSAFFGLPQPVSNPADAIMYLGLSTLRSLVLSMQVFSQFDQKACELFSLDVLERHSWLTGVSARRIARYERRDAKFLDQCFLAGLLHDIGELILATSLGKEYGDVLHAAKAQNRPVWQVEAEHFGASHADVGAYLLALWGLPNPIIEAVAMHHSPSLSIGATFTPAIAVHAADAFQHEHPGLNTELPPPSLDVEYLASLGLADQIADWRTACLDETESE